MTLYLIPDKSFDMQSVGKIIVLCCSAELLIPIHCHVQLCLLVYSLVFSREACNGSFPDSV